MVCHKCSSTFTLQRELGYEDERVRTCNPCRGEVPGVKVLPTTESRDYRSRALNFLRKGDGFKGHLEITQEDWSVGAHSIVHKGVWRNWDDMVQTNVAVKLYKESILEQDGELARTAGMEEQCLKAAAEKGACVHLPWRCLPVE